MPSKPRTAAAKPAATKPAAAKPAAAKPAAAKPAVAKPAKVDELKMLRGELDRLTTVRGKYPPLTPSLSAKLLQNYDEPTCREKGSGTRAKDIFQIAVGWARIAEANPDEPGLDTIRVRWFLDCAAALGNLLTGTAPGVSPGHDGAFDDAVKRATELLKRTERRLRDAVGGNRAWRRAIDAALTPDDQQNEFVSRLHQMSAQLAAWQGADAELLAAFGVPDASTLAEAARALEVAIQHRPAAAVLNANDPPPVNVAEGRLLYAMRTIWDDLAEARADGTSSLKLTVSPALLRGLDLKHRSSATATPDPEAEATAGEVPPTPVAKKKKKKK